MKNDKKGSHAYLGIALIGLFIALYIYIIRFDEFSESEMVFYTPFWLFPICLGYYGFVAHRILNKEEESSVEKVSDKIFEFIKNNIGGLSFFFAILINAPLLFVKTKSVIVTALGGAIIWTLAMILFFQYIFPGL